MKALSRILLLLLLAATAPAQAPPALGERVVIEDEVLARWEQVSRLQLSERTRAWIEEGRQVLERYRELQALEAKAGGDAQGGLNIEVSKLKLRLLHILGAIEEARLFDLGPDELRRLQGDYERERATLLARRDQVRDSVLGKGERFLESYRQDRNLQRFSQRDVVAKLCLQLAELYYQRSEERYFAAQDSQMARVERGWPAGPEPVREYEDAVRKYQRIIDEFPFSDYMDDALYSVAYIRENARDARQVEESRRLYEHLVRDFPASRFAPEGWMRLGEYWFRQNGEEAVRQAIACYGKILEYPDYPSREKALYKLGWCHYRLQEHEKSVEFFAEAAKYAWRKQQGGEELGAALLDESIAYLAVNYADNEWGKANVGELSALVRGDEELRRSVGFRVLDRYGDLFREETQDFPRAVTAYDSLLALYPLDAKAPFIQEKVISCYAPGALADAQAAYREKNQLYELYSGQGAWRPDSTEKEQVDGLLRRHQLENVGIAMDHAYATKRRSDFDEFLTQSRRYLQSFPADTAAFNIHWNVAKTLETELAEPRAAYDEYLAISRGYPERDRRDAAYNAIALSQVLVDQEARAQAPVVAAPDSTGAVPATPLTPMEELKKGALENFIALYPQDGRAPGYRLLEGKLHYAHRDFSAATALFDSLITAWPQAPEVAEAYQLKLEGLFALGRFNEAEAIAREIQGMALPAEAIAQARRRQAESVYSFAAGLKKSADHLKAAQEFKRVALDVPDAAFADASLFDAASEFTLAQEHAQAAETYHYLAEHYPKSTFADQALSLEGFIALNELKDQGRAARVFEQLAQSYPDSPYAKTAISNSSFCYLKTGEWASAIRMNTLYVERYPQAEDAAAVLFDNAGLWLKLDNVAAANGIYADFARNYPQDPRTVQAYVERAEYFARQQDAPAALTEYRQAVERNRMLLGRGGAGSPIYASRALRKLVERRFEDYRALRLMQPAVQLERDLAAKKAARDGLLAELNELIGLGAGDIFYARHHIAAVHDEFARAYREQERPAWSAPAARLQGEVDIEETALELTRVAARSYVGTVGELERVVEELQKQQRALAARRTALDAWLAAAAQDSAGASDDSLAQQAALARSADLLDSSLVESTVWTGRSREAVPGMVMAMLAVYEQRVELALALRSQYDKDVFLRLADTDKNLLGGVALQAVQGVLAAYREGLETIGQVGLDRLWRPRVEERLRGVLFQVPRAGAAFRGQCGVEFDAMVERFLAVVDKGENYTDREGLGEEDYGSDVLDMADFNKGYALSSLLLCDKLLQSLEENNLAGTLAGELSDTLAAQALACSALMKERQAALQTRKADYWGRFEKSASYVHQDASTTLDDASFYFAQTSKEVLVAAEPVISRVRPGSPPARRLLVSLAELDPATFGSRFGLSEDSLQVAGSAQWRVHRGYEEGFEKPDHDLGAWLSAETVARPGLDGLLPGVPVIWAPRPGAAATAGADTLAALADSLTLADQAARDLATPAGADTLYFRYAFELPGTPVGAQMQLAADDAFAVFFNGEYIDEQAGGGDEAPAPTEVRSYDLKEFLKTGSNVLAVEVRDRDGSGGGLALGLKARQIARLTPEMLEAQLQREQEEQRRLDFQRKVGRIDVKNRVD